MCLSEEGWAAVQLYAGRSEEHSAVKRGEQLWISVSERERGEPLLMGRKSKLIMHLIMLLCGLFMHLISSHPYSFSNKALAKLQWNTAESQMKERTLHRRKTHMGRLSRDWYLLRHCASQIYLKLEAVLIVNVFYLERKIKKFRLANGPFLPQVVLLPTIPFHAKCFI